MVRKSKSKKIHGERSSLPPVQDEVVDENPQDVPPANLKKENENLKEENERLKKENEHLKNENEHLKNENEHLKKENKTLKIEKVNLEEQNKILKKEKETCLGQLALFDEKKLMDEQFLKEEKTKNQGQNISCLTQENSMEIVDDTYVEDVYNNKPLKEIEEKTGNKWEGACADDPKTDWASSSDWPVEDEDSKINIGSSTTTKTYFTHNVHLYPEKGSGPSGYDGDFRHNPRNGKRFSDSSVDNDRKRGQDGYQQTSRNRNGYYDSSFDDNRNRGNTEYQQSPRNRKGHQDPECDDIRNRGPTFNYQRNEGRKANIHDPNRTYKTFSYHHEDYNQRSNRKFPFDNERRRDNYSSRSDTKEKQGSRRLKLTEVNGDLFEAPGDISLAHCVAADLRMGSGIAVEFKRKFKRVNELMDQRKKVGEVAVLEDNGRFIYYLVTKKFSTGKPVISDLQSSLLEMRDHMEKNAAMNVAMPRIGCGLDRLHWKEVRALLVEVFADLDVTITVYNFTISYKADIPKKSSLHITNKLMNLVDIEKNTLLLLFGSENGHVDSNMKKLDEKYRFRNDYMIHSRSIGDVIELKKSGEILCILIVKKDFSNVISYSALTDCLIKVRKIFKEESFFYMGLSAFMDENDDLTVAKIITLFKVLFDNLQSELWICWPPELKNLYDEYFPQNG